jgi:hypothetical protein
MAKRRTSSRKSKSDGGLPGLLAACRRAVAGPVGERRAVWGRRVLILLAIIVLVAGGWGSLEVERYVRQDDRLRVENWNLSFAETPSWVTPEIREELSSIDLGHPDKHLTVLDEGVVDHFVACLKTSAWVHTVDDLQLVYPTSKDPGTLQVSVWLREPVLLVKKDGLYYLTDADARRLGAGYADPPTEWFGVPLLIGLDDVGEMPAEGGRWPSRDVRQGVEVARVLHESGVLRQFPRERIDAIDLSNLHGASQPRESEISLWWAKCRLEWGRSPISAGAQTVETSEVIRNLRLVLSNADVYRGYSQIHLYRRGEFMTGVRAD